MTKLIVANWKMNPSGQREARALATGISKFAKRNKNVEIVLCPPFPYLFLAGSKSAGLKLGAQNTFWEKSGPFTGEVSPTMLKSLGVEHAIIGHSERRRWLKETDEMINKKALSALRAGLKIILCVGEAAEVRRKGLAAAKNFVKSQLAKDLKGAPGVIGHKSSVIIAYEPIWAIGTGKSDRPEETIQMAQFIKNFINCRVLYGGSVTSGNIKSFLQHKEIDGALVGGASLKTEEFKKIISISSKI